MTFYYFIHLNDSKRSMDNKVEGVCLALFLPQGFPDHLTCPSHRIHISFYPEPSTSWNFSRGPHHSAFHLYIFLSHLLGLRTILLFLVPCSASFMVGDEPELCWTHPFFKKHLKLLAFKLRKLMCCWYSLVSQVTL